jgi:hypothetical protein
MALKLTQLAAKPQLVKLTINHPHIVEKYGDELEFHIYDRRNIEDFVQIATASANDQAGMVKMISRLIMNEDGKPALKADETLPDDVMMAVVNAVVDQLGK